MRKAYTDALHQDMIVCCALLAVAVLMPLGVYRKNRQSVLQQQRERHDVEIKRISKMSGMSNFNNKTGDGITAA